MGYPLDDQYYDYYELKALTRSHVCSVCEAPLTVVYGQPEDDYWGWFIRCGRELQHKGIKQQESHYKKTLRSYMGMDSTALSKLDEKQMIERVNMARFPADLNQDQKRLLAKISIEYGLDPLMSELMIYQGNPFIRIDGRRRKAQESGEFDGISSRPATKDERQARGVEDGDYLYLCQVYRKNANHAFEGWGKVTAKEIQRAKDQIGRNNRDEFSLPIVKDPGDIAEKRAESEALKRAFHLPLPSFEDISVDRGTDTPVPKVFVNAMENEGSKPPAESPKQIVYKRDPETIKDNWELCKACFEDYGLQPTDIAKELNVSNLKNLPMTPPDCYRTIAKVRS